MKLLRGSHRRDACVTKKGEPRMAVVTRTNNARGGGPHFHAEPLRRVRLGPVAWDIRLELADTFLNDHGLRLDEWQRDHRLTIIKHGPHRTVYRLDLPDGTFYLKHFRIADWKAWLRNAVRACPSELERRAVDRVAAAGLATMDVVAIGKTLRAGVVTDSFLISREIPDAVQLDDFLLTTFRELSPLRQARLRQRMAVELGSLAARMHEAGLWHVDFHAGNVLVELGEGDQPRLWLIDLHAAKFRRSLSRRQRLANIAALHQFFAGRITRTDRLRFWRAYDGGRWTVDGGRWSEDRGSRMEDDTIPSVHHAPSTVHHRRLSSLDSYFAATAESGWQRADRAWARGNRHVRKLDTPTAHCRGLATLDVTWLKSLRDDPEQLFSAATRWCKQTHTRRVAAVSLPNHVGAGGGFWKCLETRGRAVRLLARFRWSPVRRAWEMGHALLRRNIPTPRPLMFVERDDGNVQRLYLLTEAVPETITLEQLVSTLAVTPESLGRDGSDGCELVHNLADIVRRLHAAGFDHRDLKWSNVLIQNEGLVTLAPHPRPLSPCRGEGRHGVWLLDLDAVRQWRWLPRFRRVQNLSRLAVSSLQHAAVRRTDRLRFLRHYLGDRFAAEWKSWWRQIACRAESKIERNRRVGRPVS
jgi:tRNA A-37 threonylcarbamoyl transferase component Bud32